jgi:hypothetical protein
VARATLLVVMTSMLHRDDGASPFDHRRQHAELDYLITSDAAMTSLAEITPARRSRDADGPRRKQHAQDAVRSGEILHAGGAASM